MRRGLSTTRTLKQRIAIRDGNECWYCGKPLLGRPSTLEHLKAQSIGGDDHPENLRLSCGWCNNVMASLPVEKKTAIRELARAEPSVTRAKALIKRELGRLKKSGIRVCEQRPFRKTKWNYFTRKAPDDRLSERKLKDAFLAWGLETPAGEPTSD